MEPLKPEYFLSNEAEETAFYNHDSNRAVAVVWPAIVENRLTDVLRAAMRADKKTADEMLRPDGLLGTFGGKIKLGYMLGLYGSDMRDDLVLLAKIRNAFAHRVDITEFEVSPVKDWMDSMNTLKVHRSLLKSKQEDSASDTSDRTHFTLLFILRNELMDYRSSFHLIIRFLTHQLVNLEAQLKPPEDPSQETVPSRDVQPPTTEASAQANSLDQEYEISRSKFSGAVAQATTTSRACAGINAGEHRYWASLLYTKVCTTAFSILNLCPLGNMSHSKCHWDFSSVAALSRNLLRYVAVFFYIGIEEVSEAEWRARRDVIYLHDCLARLQLFMSMSAEKETQGFEGAKRDLISRLDQNEFFKMLPGSVRAEIVAGERWSTHTEEEMLIETELLDRFGRGYCRFLSCHGRALPSAFARMSVDNTGRGVESETEKAQVTVALNFCTEVLQRSTADMRKAFSGLVDFPPETTA